MKQEIKKILSLKDIENIEDKLNYTFKKKNLLTQAFTRKSFGVENNVPYNDVLKIVGDTVSKTLVTQLATNINFNIEKFPNTGKYPKDLESPYEEYEKKLFRPIEYKKRLLKVSLIATNIFDDFYRNSKIIEDLFGVTIEQFLDKEITRYSDENLIDYSIRKLLFDKLILMNKSDINNKLIEKSEIMVELYKSIMGAVAIDSEWDYNQLEEVFFNLIDFPGYDSLETKVDFVSMLEQWYHKNFKELINYNYTHDTNNNIHICEIDFTYEGINYKLVGEAENKKKARQECCKKVIAELKAKGALSKTKTLALELSKLDGNNAINLLQELYQKKLCPEPHYEFEVEYDKDGNPIWKCSLDLARKVKGETFVDIYPFSPVSFSSKKDAKKMVAYKNLILVSDQILKAQELDVEIIRYNKNDNI